ncbi:putative peptidyl-prolyl cis-trans isomerase C27F1.06c [Schizosaccharomyces pombe]
MSKEETLYSVKVDQERVPLFDEDFYKGFRSELSVRFTMAALDPRAKSNDAVTVNVITRLEHPEEDGEESDEELFQEEKFTLCTLKKGSVYQQPIDIIFSPGEEVFFERVGGDIPVYLSGTCIITNIPEEEDSSDLENDFLYGADELSSDEEEMDDISVTSSEEEEEENGARIEELNSDEEDAEQAEEEILEKPVPKDEVAEKHSKDKLKKEEKEKKTAVDVSDTANGKKRKTELAGEGEQTEKKSKPTKTYPKQVLEGNVTVQDKVKGDGPAAKRKKRVSMRYIGRLTNGKVFDKNITGKPFTFNLGLEEVIKGWDVGIVGMQVGGERTIHIPAAMAYGSKRLPGIPANSDLVFDVKLLAVN